MKTGVLMVWTGCLVSITLSVLHFAWIATAVERVLVLALLALARSFRSGPSEIRRNLYAKNYAPDLAGRAVAVTLVALAFTDTIPSGSFLFWLLFALAAGLVLLGGGWRKRR